MVVVGADYLAQHVIGQVGHGLRVFDVHRAVALHYDGLYLLGAHDGAQAAACGVGTGVHHIGVREQVLASRPDAADAAIVALNLVQGLGCQMDALAPDEACVLDLHVVVFDAQVHGGCGLAFQNEGVPTCQLQLGSEHAAAVCVYQQIVGGEGGQEADRGAACQRHA